MDERMKRGCKEQRQPRDPLILRETIYMIPYHTYSYFPQARHRFKNTLSVATLKEGYVERFL